MKSSLCRSCLRDLIWVESVRIINLSWHRSWEEAAQASVMGLSVWGVDRLHWKQKMKPYKSVIVTPVLTSRELPACIWFSLPAYRCNFYAVFPLQCGSLGTQARVVGLGSLKKKKWKGTYYGKLSLLNPATMNFTVPLQVRMSQPCADTNSTSPSCPGASGGEAGL